jgi:ATP synthase protein I
MIPPQPDRPAALDAMLRSTRRAGARDLRWRDENLPPVAGRLAQIGVLGWMIVTPMLIGVFTGGWLDRRFHSGLFYTAPLLMVGAGLGCWWGWRWMQKH